VNLDEREFCLYPRRPRRSRSNELRAWSLAFKQILYFARMSDWQKSGDKRLFRFIISPGFGDRVDLERLTRDLTTRMERDLATHLEWVAVSTSIPGIHMFMFMSPCVGEEPTVRLSCWIEIM
jgi:hypothetical protein